MMRNACGKMTATLFVIAAFLLASLAIFSGCSNTKALTFQKKLERMSDDDLLNTYYGINDRIRDIDNGIRNSAHPDDTEQERFMSHSSFYIGGEGYELMRKKKQILKELDKRNITP